MNIVKVVTLVLMVLMVSNTVHAFDKEEIEILRVIVENIQLEASMERVKLRLEFKVEIEQLQRQVKELSDTQTDLINALNVLVERSKKQ